MSSFTLRIGTPAVVDPAPAEMPVISRGLPSTNAALNNGTYHDPANDGVTDYAINLNSLTSAERSNVLCVWWSPRRPTVPDAGPRYNTPADYTLQGNVSTSGTKPVSSWVTLATVTSNVLSTRVHTGLDLSSYGWFRMNVTADNGVGVAIQLDLRDARDGTDDVITFYGDSNAQDGYNPNNLGGNIAHAIGSMETMIESETGRAAPVLLNYGYGGSTAASLLSDIDDITGLPGAYVVLGPFGTNDAANAGAAFASGSATALNWKAAVQDMIDAIETAGKTVLLTTVPWGDANATHDDNVVVLNGKIAELLSENPSVLPGPDLFALANGQQNLIDDGRHFSYDAGTQPVTSGHPLGVADGLTGYEAMLRLTVDVLEGEVYGL